MTTPAAYTLPDFLTRFGVSRTQAYRELNAGRLKAIKRGNRTIITAEAAQAWLEAMPAYAPASAA